LIPRAGHAKDESYEKVKETLAVIPEEVRAVISVEGCGD
jgi:hypothetical protein